MEQNSPWRNLAMNRTLIVTLVLGALAPCLFGQLIDETKVVDLTYSFDETTVYWPNAEPFQREKQMWKITPGGYWYAAAKFSMSEHCGTHFDSPIHFGQAKLTAERIPVSRFIGPAVVIDVSRSAAANRDYRMTAADIQAWEKEYGPVSSQSIVLVHTGWGKYWPDRKRYLGSDVPGDVEHLHFPGISKEAAEMLVAREVDGVGIDTASLDYGPSRDFITHQVLNNADIFGLENVANLEKLPLKGATLIALPMKITNGTGGPVRIIAILP